MPDGHPVLDWAEWSWRLRRDGKRGGAGAAGNESAETRDTCVIVQDSTELADESGGLLEAASNDAGGDIEFEHWFANLAGEQESIGRRKCEWFGEGAQFPGSIDGGQLSGPVRSFEESQSSRAGFGRCLAQSAAGDGRCQPIWI